ncbi:acyltransferase family protein [Actinokineospora sp. NPDC004072]
MTQLHQVPRTPDTLSPGARIPALDGLRGLAVAAVLLFHAGGISGGFLGVDLFFALSGYLITDLLLREAAATGSVSLTAFWQRRIRRLAPALVVVLVIATVVVWAAGMTDLWSSALSDGPWVQLNLVNWHLIGESAGYWDRFGADRLFGHLWSIAVEEQFYLLWPVAVLFLARRAVRVSRAVALLAVVVSLASLALMIVLVGDGDTTRVYTGTDTRAFSLMLGALAATEPARNLLRRITGRLAGAVCAVLLAGIAMSWLLVDGETSRGLFHGGLFAHSLAAAALVALCAQAPENTVARALGTPSLRWLGLISYSLYLWHWPVFLVLSAERLGVSGWLWATLVCAVSICLAALSRRFVEDPIRFRAGWARKRTGGVVFAAVMAALALFWVVVPRPAAQTVDPGALGSPGTVSTSGPRMSKVLFMGDSIAAGQALPLAAAMKAAGVGFTSIAADGGGGVVGPLAETTWQTLPATLETVRPDVVIYQVTTYDWGTEAEQRIGYQRLADAATGIGATVVFVTMPPIVPDEFYSPHMPDLGRTASVAQKIAEESAGRVIVLDSAEVWGPGFQRERDGKADRSSDGIHTCPHGAARFTTWLMTQLTARFSGVAQADPATWANTGWAADDRFKGC